VELAKYQFIKNIAELSSVEEIWLFGSRARGDAIERSDIDLAIVCPKATQDDWHTIQRIVSEADTLFKIDCVRFDTLNEKSPFYQSIVQSKRLIYTRTGGFMEKSSLEFAFNRLQDALTSLQAGISHPNVEVDLLLRDGVIQRFEYTIELFWKTLKKILAYEKQISTAPRDVLEKAFQYSLIDDEKAWLKMLDDRNNTSHTYEEEVAMQIFRNIKTHYPIMQETFDQLRKKFLDS
jgi:nucleotidyltransferase substrate binding protein (TIGR01987 family)